MNILIVYNGAKPSNYTSTPDIEFSYYRYGADLSELIGNRYDAVVMDYDAAQDPRINQFVKDKVTRANRKA